MKKEAALASLLALSGLGIAGDIALQPRYEMAFAQTQETQAMTFGTNKLSTTSIYNLSEEEQYALILYILRQNLVPTLQTLTADGDTLEDIHFGINGQIYNEDNKLLQEFFAAFGWNEEGLENPDDFPQTPQEFLEALQGTNYDIYDTLASNVYDDGGKSKFAAFKLCFDKTLGFGSVFIPWSYTSYVDSRKVVKNDLFIRQPLTLTWNTQDGDEDTTETLSIKPETRRISLNDMVTEQSGISIGGVNYKLGPESTMRYLLNEDATGDVADLDWESSPEGDFVPVIESNWMRLSPAPVSEFLHKLYPEIPADAQVIVVDKDDPDSVTLAGIDRDKDAYTVIITGTGPEKAPSNFHDTFRPNIRIQDAEGPVGIRIESFNAQRPDIVRPLSGYIDMILIPAGEDPTARKLHLDIITDRTLFKAQGTNFESGSPTITSVTPALDYMMEHGSYDGKFLVGIYDYLGGNSTGMFHAAHALGLKLTIPGISGFSHTFLFSDKSAFSFDNYSAGVAGSTEEPATYLEWSALQKIKEQLLAEYPSDAAPRAAINAVDKWRFELVLKPGYQSYPLASTTISNYENIAFNIIKSPSYRYILLDQAGKELSEGDLKTATVERKDSDGTQLMGTVSVSDILNNTQVADPQILSTLGLRLPEHMYLKGMLAQGASALDQFMPRGTKSVSFPVEPLESKTDTVNEIKLVAAPIPVWAQIKFINDETGEELKPTQTIKNKQWGDSLDLSTLSDLTIAGYELAQTPETVRLTGDVIEGAQGFDPGHYVNEFTIHYRVAQTQATVQYLNAETGEALAAPVTKELLVGKAYDLNSLIKSFEGYEMSAVPSTIAGTAGKDAFTITLNYTPKTYKITVVAVDSKTNKPLELKGEQGKLTPQVFEQTCAFNKNYAVQVPVIVDYHADLTDEIKAQLSGRMPAKDLEIRIPYSHDVANAETQTEVSSAEAGTQTDNPEHVDGSTQTEGAPTTESGTQTEKPATAEGEAQTEGPKTEDQGIQTDPVDTQDSAVQTEPSHETQPQEKPASPATPQESEKPAHVDAGTQTDPEYQAVVEQPRQDTVPAHAESPKHARVQGKHAALPATGESSVALIAAMAGLISAAGAALAKRLMKR